MTRTYSLAVAVAVVALITSAGFAFADTARGRGVVARLDRSINLITQVVPSSVSSTPSSTGTSVAGNNGGVNSGNGGNGGNAGVGGSVRSGNVSSSADAVNIMNTVIIRIGRW